MLKLQTWPEKPSWTTTAYELYYERSQTPGQNAQAFTRKSGNTLNAYGDEGRVIPGNLGYGTDISFDRIDDLDFEAMGYVENLVRKVGPRQINCADLGCGLGRLSIEFALRGANVFSFDLADTSEIIDVALHERAEAAGLRRGAIGAIRFYQSDLRKVSFDDFKVELDVVYSQRALHYMSQADLANLLTRIKPVLRGEAHLFLSVSGLHSALSRGYGHKENPLQKRFSRLNRGDKDLSKHGINQPVCLYTKDEFVSVVESAGFTTLSAQTSSFGNVKCIFKNAI